MKEKEKSPLQLHGERTLHQLRALCEDVAPSGVREEPRGRRLQLTREGDKSLTPHPATQQAELDQWAVLLLEPSEQRHKVLHRHPRAQVLQIQHL